MFAEPLRVELLGVVAAAAAAVVVDVCILLFICSCCFVVGLFLDGISSRYIFFKLYVSTYFLLLALYPLWCSFGMHA